MNASERGHVTRVETIGSIRKRATERLLPPRGIAMRQLGQRAGPQQRPLFDCPLSAGKDRERDPADVRPLPDPRPRRDAHFSIGQLLRFIALGRRPTRADKSSETGASIRENCRLPRARFAFNRQKRDDPRRAPYLQCSEPRKAAGCARGIPKHRCDLSASKPSDGRAKTARLSG